MASEWLRADHRFSRVGGEREVCTNRCVIVGYLWAERERGKGGGKGRGRGMGRSGTGRRRRGRGYCGH